MKSTFLPKTKTGTRSILLFLLSIILGAASSIISHAQNNMIEYPNPLNSPLLGTMLYLTFAAAICSSFTGLFAINKHKERAILVYMIIPPGIIFLFFILVFMVANLIGPPGA